MKVCPVKAVCRGVRSVREDTHTHTPPGKDPPEVLKRVVVVNEEVGLHLDFQMS